jgi:1,2-dihydroxy-3-keto-5-methylthiopentene dioxygenase
MRAVRVKAGEEIECSQAELQAEGIRCEPFDLSAAAAVVQRIQAERGWTEVEEVTRSTSRPQDEAEVVKEADEHCHLAEEVRVLLEGHGVYDIRGLAEDWLRIFVAAGEVVVVPARRYHRFLVGQSSVLRYAQPYLGRHDLMHLYRASEDRTRAF